jgi:hypothetical protein
MGPRYRRFAGGRVIPANESQIILEDDAYSRRKPDDLGTLGSELRRALRVES